jgi:hypothetical protein
MYYYGLQINWEFKHKKMICLWQESRRDYTKAVLNQYVRMYLTKSAIFKEQFAHPACAGH